MGKIKIEATKFTIVGAANFVLTFAIFTFMLKLMLVNYMISLGVAWAIGMLFSYVLNFIWVFKPESEVKFNCRFIKFLLAGLSSVVLNMLALNYLVTHTGFDPFYIQSALIPFIVIINFLTSKYWSLKSKNDIFSDT